MLNLLLSILWLLLPGTAPATTPHQAPPASAQDEQKRPAQVLLGSLTKYYVGVFWTTAKWTEASEGDIRSHVQKNMADIKELVKSGKLAGVASVPGKSDCKMVVFFKTDSEEEARTLAEKSYAVKQGLLTANIIRVWGTRGLGEGLAKEMNKESKATPKQETFYLTILSKGKTWSDKPDESLLSLVDVHATNVMKLRDSGMLKFYGAVEGNGPVRNISILKGASVEDVQKKLSAGELIKKEWFTASVYQCNVPAGTLP